MDGALADFERSLDERARVALRELPEDVALNLLRDCQSRNVRNPSAYVFVAARKARPGQLADTIERLKGDLDDKAIAQLRDLPSDESMRILDELATNWDQVRNPSAYVSTAVKNSRENIPKGASAAATATGGSVSGVAAGTSGAAGGAAPGAAGLMMGAAMDPSMAAMMGQPMGCGMFGGMPMAAMAAAQQMAQPCMMTPMGMAMATPMGMAPMMSAMSPMGTPMAAMAAMAAQPGAMGGMPGCFGGFCAQPGMAAAMAFPPSQKQIEEELEASISRLGLDASANEALHRVPFETAKEIITALDGGVRNPSAFVMAKIRSLQGSAAGSGIATASRAAAAGGTAVTLAEKPPESREELQAHNTATLDRLGVDERARSIAHEIPPEALFDIFNQLTGSGREIRNPSAFIFQACVNHQKQHPQGSGYPSFPSLQPSVTKLGATAEQVNEAIQRFDLDATASAEMRALPPENAMHILDKITEGVKNKSAFATTAARRLVRGRSRSRSRSYGRRPGAAFGETGSAPLLHGRERSRSRDRHLHEIAATQLLHSTTPEDAQRKFDLDETARGCLSAIPPSEAREILDSIDDGLRNPSAFVTAQVRRLHPELPIPVPGMARSSESGSGTPGGRTLRSSFPPGMSQKEMEVEVEHIMKDMRLDERASGVLHEVPLDKALDILGELKRNWNSVRNPSAYVFNACVKEINQGKGGAASSPQQPAGAAAAAFPPAPPGMPYPPPGPSPGAPGLSSPSSSRMDRGMRREVDQMFYPQPGPPQAALDPFGNDHAMAAKAESMARDLGIDETSLAALQTIPLETALHVLNRLSDSRGGIRNPSGFIISAVKDYRLQQSGGGGHDGMPSGMDRTSTARHLDSAIERLNLDRTAIEALRALPDEDALAILKRVDGNVRSPSAWVTNAARKALQQQGAGPCAGSVASSAYHRGAERDQW